MKEIVFKDVSKSYGNNKVVNCLNMTINEGERLVILGPSGCGKSTTLRIIAGLEGITSGELYMDGKCVNNVSSGDRNVAMVFQNYALFPHMTVAKNITYALRVNKVPADEIKKRLNQAVEMLRLHGLENRKPKELSGGQRQRVALARAVVKQGDFFLLDEPLSNLDAQLRGHARKELVKIHEVYKQTFIYVTHDQVEAMTVANRIALMYKGDLQMLDTPQNIYNRPSNIFTAKFIGSPATNVVDVSYKNGKIRLGLQSVTLIDSWISLIDNAKPHEISIGIRPEHVQLSTECQANSFKGVVKYIENYGAQVVVYFDVEGNEIIAAMPVANFRKNEAVYFTLNFDKLHVFDTHTTNSLGYPDGINIDQNLDMPLEVNRR
ncbi:MAG: sugar ABC transporter ATP-binding protein [Epulopiscium sp. Nele67-Bin001]|nr:MAG: sugar ABC transporter ATP-binding protein [Epulopiscium sp. Nele67-Bin001]